MFAIGDKEWPGISKLIEEAGEVLQVCGKLIATGGNTEHWDNNDTPLKERLENEIADLLAAAAFVVRRCGLDGGRVDDRVKRKLTRFVTWHEQGEANKGPRCTAFVTPHGKPSGRCILMAEHDGDHQL